MRPEIVAKGHSLSRNRWTLRDRNSIKQLGEFGSGKAIRKQLIFASPAKERLLNETLKRLFFKNKKFRSKLKKLNKNARAWVMVDIPAGYYELIMKAIMDIKLLVVYVQKYRFKKRRVSDGPENQLTEEGGHNKNWLAQWPELEMKNRSETDDRCGW